MSRQDVTMRAKDANSEPNGGDLQPASIGAPSLPAQHSLPRKPSPCSVEGLTSVRHGHQSCLCTLTEYEQSAKGMGGGSGWHHAAGTSAAPSRAAAGSALLWLLGHPSLDLLVQGVALQNQG